MKKIHIALLSGGISSEREVSLRSGEQVYIALDKKKYTITRYDPRTDLERLVADAPLIDAALIILHGPYGEDGRIQGLLDLLNIPYQGSGVLGSAVAMDKVVSKQLYEKAGIPVPPYIVVDRESPVKADECVGRIGLPLVVKPATGGSSIGMSVVRAKEGFPEALDKGFAQDDRLLLEGFIDGTELTGGVLGNERLQALPLVEIVPGKKHDFFDYDAKYTPGACMEICPARVHPAVSEKAMAYAMMAHRALYCKGYSRTDMMLSKADNALYVLETNTIPGMTKTSLLPQAAQAAGIDFPSLLDRLIQLSLSDREKK